MGIVYLFQTPYPMRNEPDQVRPDFSQPCQPLTENFANCEDLSSTISSVTIFKDDAMRDNHQRPRVPDSRISAVKQRRSRRIILLTIALAASLSICSVRWIMEKKTAVAVVKAVPSAQPVVDQAPVSKPVVKNETVAVQEKAEHHPLKVVAVAPDPAKKFRNDWWQYITADHSSYAYGVLGGISDLSVVVSNKTDYVLDEVTAKVTIMKANGKPWKTKTVTIYAVPAHSDKKELLPKVNRGKSVDVILMKIVSKKMHFNYPGNAKNGGDPYYMN
jgi:hypothetical protein